MARLPRPGSIRNVVTGHSDGYTGRVPFPRLGGRTVAFESLLSRDFLVVTAAFDADVAAITSEPKMLVAHIDGEPVRWTPDYEITRADGSLEYVEVKAIEIVEPGRARRPLGDEQEVQRLQEEADAQFAALEVASMQDGHAFRLVTEDQIRIEPRLGNAELILGHGDGFYPPAQLLAGCEALARHRPDGIAALQDIMPQLDALVLAIRLQLIGALELDGSRPFRRDTGFTLASSENDGSAGKEASR